METRIYSRDHFPFVRLLLAWLIGIAVGYVFNPTPFRYNILITLSVFSLLVFFAIVHSRKRKNNTSYSGPALLFTMVLFACISLWNRDPAIQKMHFSHFETEALVGVIMSEPKHTEKYIRFELNVKNGLMDGQYHVMSGKLLINLKQAVQNSPLRYGDQLIIQSNYQEVSPPFNPGDFNYKRYLSNNAIWHTAFLSENQLQKVKDMEGNFIVEYALLLRQKMLAKLEQQLSNNSALLVASALVLGYRNDMEKDVMDIFTNTGTVHVLAVSGLHVGIVFVVFSALLFGMNRNTKLKLLKGLLLLLLIWGYALITGFSPSVLRAAIMISFTLVAFHLVKDHNIYNTIAASAFMMLIYNPRFISHVGFQLSYLALLGIIYLYPKAKNLYKGENVVLKWIWSYSALSIVAQVATFPLVIYYFNNFPLYFLPANLFIILPATLIVYLGFLVLFLPYGIIATYMAALLQMLILFCISVLEALSSLPLAKITGFSLSIWQLGLLYSFIVLIIFTLTMRKRALLFAALFSFIILAAIRAKEYIVDDLNTEVRLYNVNRNLFIGIYNANEFVSYTDSAFAKTNGYHYSLQNLRLERGVKRLNSVLYPEKYKKENIIIDHPLIQVKNKRMIILDKAYDLNGVVSADIILIRNNHRLDLREIMKQIRFNKLILDGSNSPRTIEYYIENAEKLTVPYYILKNNYAYVW